MRGRLAAFAVLLALAPGAAAADVRVRYVAPERFNDAENRFGSELSLRATLAEMTLILEELSRRHMPPGKSFEIAVLDIDLAGFERSGFSTGQTVRVVTDATPPRIRFAYTLRRAGRPIAAGEETLSDIDFMLTANPRFAAGGLHDERALLRDWFARRFPASNRG